MSFVRVRGATPGDPLHEFDAPETRVRNHPDLYEVIDPEPVAATRPASFVPGRVPKKSAPTGAKRAAKKRPRKDLVKPNAPAGADS